MRVLPEQSGHERAIAMTHQRAHLCRTVGLSVAASLLLAPMTMLMPQQASAHDAAVEGARVATSDLAVTERLLEEISAPEGYSDSGRKESATVRQDEAALQPASESSVNGVREDLSLARALVSSPTAILGVTFPLNNADETVTISYRTRWEDQWSEWTLMELADAGVAPEYVESVTLGTEPVPLTHANEVEVAVRTADGESLPGAQLTLIEPELSTEELADAQREAHGEHALDAVESLVDDILTSEASGKAAATPNPDLGGAQGHADSLKEVIPASPPTPAETAETYAEITVPAVGMRGSRGTLGSLGIIRAVGPTSDGRSYITDISGLSFTTRKGWGADERVMDWKPEKTTFRGAVVHHTAGSNNYSRAQVPGIVRGIYRYHAVTLGWGDVGYHFLVDKFGGVWEGRAGGVTNSVKAGHAFGANSTTFGISVLGDYTHEPPTDEAVDAVAKAVAWKLKIHNITNLDATFTTKGNQSGKSSIQLPIVSAHRHVGGTSCPGDAFMARWDELVRKVEEYSKPAAAPRATPSAPPARKTSPQWGSRQGIGTGWNIGLTLAAGAFSAKGNTDAMLIDSAGRLWLYPGVKNSSFPYSRRLIGTGWQTMDQVAAGVDFDGDGITDIVARVRSNGDLRLYSGDGRGGFRSVRRIGTGWNMFIKVYTVADMANGNPVVYGVEPSGKLRAYLTDGRGRFTSALQMGGGWSVMRDFLTVGDKTGDGVSDLVVADSAGALWMYTGYNGYLGGRVQIGHGWEGLSPILSSGDDGNLWTVNPQGDLFRYVFLGIS